MAFIMDTGKLHLFLDTAYDEAAKQLPKKHPVGSPLLPASYQVLILSMFKMMLKNKASEQTNLVLLLTVILQTAMRHEKFVYLESSTNTLNEQFSFERYQKEQYNILVSLKDMFPHEFTLAAQLVSYYAAPGLSLNLPAS